MEEQNDEAHCGQLQMTLDAYLIRSQQRKKLREARVAEEQSRKEAAIKAVDECKNVVTQLEERFPNLKKTLKEVQEVDLALPQEIFPHQGDDTPEAENESAEAPEQTGHSFFLWSTHRNGLADRLGSVHLETGTGLSRMAVSQRGLSAKRTRSDEATAAAVGQKKLRKIHSTESVATSAVDEQKRAAKLRRRLVEVDVAKVGPSIDPALLKLYHTALDPAVQSVMHIQARLLVKKILMPIHVEITTRVFYVELSVADGDGVPCGFVVGCDGGFLYVKEFLKDREEKTRAALEGIDIKDSGSSPASFGKKGKPCYQWMQRLVDNRNGIYFTASDLCGIVEPLTITDVFSSILQQK